MKLYEWLFPPMGKIEPCGMFTFDHIISLIVFMFIILISYRVMKNKGKERLIHYTRVLAIIITILESIKIGFNLINGYTWLDAWLPLSYCSLFIYALWFSGYGKGNIKKIGDSFITIGCFVGGFFFLIFPITSFNSYPVYHFLSIYSMLFHSCMIVMSILFIKYKTCIINKESFNYYLLYFIIGASICIILNRNLNTNLMLLREPYKIPLKFVHTIYNYSGFIYTILVLLTYIIGPSFVSYNIEKRINELEK